MISISKAAASAIALLSGVLLAGCLPREVVCKCYCDGRDRPRDPGAIARGQVEDHDISEIPPPTNARADIDASSSADGGVADAEPRPAADSECAGEIGFRDELFEAMVRKHLRKPHGPITGNDVAAITKLSNEDGNGRLTKIKDISGIQCFRRLESLTLKGIDSGEIGKLSGLRWLRQLDLSDSGLEDISALSGLDGLRELRLSGNRITDLGPLQGLRGLRKLSLTKNGLRKTAGLEHLVELESLLLEGNRIEDIGFVKALPSLRQLNLANNGLTRIDPLVGATPLLEWLVLSDNRIRDVSALSRTAQKRKRGGELHLWRNGIDCEKARRDLVAISALWSDVGIECEEFNTAGP